MKNVPSPTLSLDEPALLGGLLPQDALVFHEFAQHLATALCREDVLGDVAWDRAIQRVDRDSIARATDAMPAQLLLMHAGP